MKTKISIPILLLAILTGCATGRSVFRNNIEEKGVVFCYLQKGQYLCVINTDYEHGAYWFLIQGRYQNHELGRSLSALPEIERMVPSPDNKFIAVLSVGEGHPFVEIFSLKDLLAMRYDKKDRPLKSIGEIDPYPGTIDIVRWRQGMLILQSDMPLERIEKKERRIKATNPADRSKIEGNAQMRNFVWNPITDTIVEE